ncbi:hypothetical protein THAOC_31176 [Thalassiosira oceanica]|uniref:Uncharacterized protein n=1 Tax=Thalassiosira oceanica TaxID=159749 RepID=K0RC90_THAOC|nr:hypothetical protein THAOC_31176 [Thalassiosira oceanica]|eukprot:EJK49899.1 hypothetical protein THAOC_31176 [Thalassiosira oceanica]
MEPDGTNMEPDGTNMEPDGTRMEPRRNQNGTKTEPKPKPPTGIERYSYALGPQSTMRVGRQLRRLVHQAEGWTNAAPSQMSSFAYILKRHQQNETVTGDVDGADSDAETHPRLPQYREYRESLKYRDSIDSSGSESDHEAVADDVTCSGIYSSDGDDSDSDEADHADKTASPRDNTSQIEAMSIDETTPLPRWQESRAKSRLIKELSNPMSDIHLLLGDNYGENNWKTVHLNLSKKRLRNGIQVQAM